MAWSPLLFILLYSLLVVTPAFELLGKIQLNDFLLDIEGLRNSKIILDNGKMQGRIMHDGNFVIPDVPAGTYILSVSSPDYSFDQYRVDVVDSQTEPEVRSYASGTSLNPPSAVLLAYPIAITPRQKHVYFVPPESFNLVAMFSNPMMLLMVFGGVMMLAMPYLMNNMEHETMNELKEQQARVAGMQGAITNGSSKSGVSTMNGEELLDSGGQHSKNSPSAKSRGNNRNKKR
ncbi:hypothetical protein BDZ94DRAFT_1271251 [Collybia nuda]|uniref:ER membrane protein complex subunit 7 beta-sandwich domain-containing protein n=1 Tax=Collybia nuda TaxID=64659 RepID=A0A9P5XWW5_9AGAR|nr:hypothetical protein BDZ94DRAFT_1271251 [Collybia nuda]